MDLVRTSVHPVKGEVCPSLWFINYKEFVQILSGTLCISPSGSSVGVHPAHGINICKSSPEKGGHLSFSPPKFVQLERWQTVLYLHRRAHMIKQGIIHEELVVNSQLRRRNGSCPVMPEEVGLLLSAMGYSPDTVIYMTGAETFGGQHVLNPLCSLFSNLVDRTSLCSEKELANLIGPEMPFSSDTQWLLWEAVDYIVSVEADAFFPGFDNDGSGWPDFSSLVMGHRLYQMGAGRTYRPNREILINLLENNQEHAYFPNRNWTAAVCDILVEVWARMASLWSPNFRSPCYF